MSEPKQGGEPAQTGNEGTQAPPGDTQNQEPTGYVEIGEASDADLDNYLARAAEFEPGAEGTEGDEPADPPANPDNKGEPQQGKDDKGPEFVKADDLPKDPPTREEYNKLVEQFRQQETFLKRRSTEIGALRKELKESKAGKQEGLEELYHSNPVEARKVEKEIDKIDAQLEQLDAEEEANAVNYVGRGLLLKHLAPGEEDVERVVEMLKADGESEETINKFRKNQFEVAPPVALVHMHKRAMVERILKRLIPNSKRILEENLRLKAELEGKQKTAPSKGVQKIVKNLSSAPPMAAGQPTGAATRQADIATKDPALMTDKELDEYLANAKD